MQVAVGSNGHVYVSDGYCNQRVVEFLANGTYLGEFTGALQTPHAVALDECKSRLYVASRESKEIVIFDYGSRTEIGAPKTTIDVLPVAAACGQTFCKPDGNHLWQIRKLAFMPMYTAGSPSRGSSVSAWLSLPQVQTDASRLQAVGTLHGRATSMTWQWGHTTCCLRCAGTETPPAALRAWCSWCPT